MKRQYPFDPLLKHHLLIGLLLAIWVFVFLYFSEPLDVNEFTAREKLIYLPAYSLIAALLYIINLPFQNWIYKKLKSNWFVFSELLFNILFVVIGIVALRLFYLQFIIDWNPNAYTLTYHVVSIILPAMLTVLPIVIVARFAFGKYHEKRLEDQKIEIKGEGNYEGLKVHLNEVISIKSSDNYIEVYYLSGNEMKKTLIRNKLSAVDDEFPELLRSHRSFLINPYHFQQWKTENGKLTILLNHNIKVPVSKTYHATIKAQINSATN
ncbi:LytTR family DNA-binding domain-containing protein [Winogradskyella ursingii]|uniref:LytTR family DNA-binding domain-containing protein n=1 Tax=Winogradskyella ursingii TaxID=2686079 RepID=UPI0015C767D8|nr:LytTR family DNA-binding domain-containing protein [Winogradskyella ursingii]